MKANNSNDPQLVIHGKYAAKNAQQGDEELDNNKEELAIHL